MEVFQSLSPTHPFLLPHPLLLRSGSDKKIRPESESRDPAMTLLSRELVFLTIQFLEEEKFEESPQAGAGVRILLQHEAHREGGAGRGVRRGRELPLRLHQGRRQPPLDEDLLRDPQAEVSRSPR